jgi:hypothetical protein
MVEKQMDGRKLTDEEVLRKLSAPVGQLVVTTEAGDTERGDQDLGYNRSGTLPKS